MIILIFFFWLGLWWMSLNLAAFSEFEKHNIKIKFRINSSGCIEIKSEGCRKRKKAEIDAILEKNINSVDIVEFGSNTHSEDVDDENETDETDETNYSVSVLKPFFIDTIASPSRKLSIRRKSFKNINLRVYCLKKNLEL